jgi:5'(3')-deoxyribonucleotidase
VQKTYEKVYFGGGCCDKCNRDYNNCTCISYAPYNNAFEDTLIDVIDYRASNKKGGIMSKTAQEIVNELLEKYDNYPERLAVDMHVSSVSIRNWAAGTKPSALGLQAILKCAKKNGVEV